MQCARSNTWLVDVGAATHIMAPSCCYQDGTGAPARSRPIKNEGLIACPIYNLNGTGAESIGLFQSLEARLGLFLFQRKQQRERAAMTIPAAASEPPSSKASKDWLLQEARGAEDDNPIVFSRSHHNSSTVQYDGGIKDNPIEL
jgi:hypothetical protein